MFDKDYSIKEVLRRLDQVLPMENVRVRVKRDTLREESGTVGCHRCKPFAPWSNTVHWLVDEVIEQFNDCCLTPSNFEGIIPVSYLSGKYFMGVGNDQYVRDCLHSFELVDFFNSDLEDTGVWFSTARTSFEFSWVKWFKHDRSFLKSLGWEDRLRVLFEERYPAAKANFLSNPARVKEILFNDFFTSNERNLSRRFEDSFYDYYGRVDDFTVADELFVSLKEMIGVKRREDFKDWFDSDDVFVVERENDIGSAYWKRWFEGSGKLMLVPRMFFLGKSQKDVDDCVMLAKLPEGVETGRELLDLLDGLHDPQSSKYSSLKEVVDAALALHS